MKQYVKGMFSDLKVYEVDGVSQLPCAFDIETTSVYDEYHNKATMYEWTFGIDKIIVYGRTWTEFLSLCDELRSYDCKFIIYVHNLAFEFGFMKDLFEWKQVFARKTHKPIYALTSDEKLEFRCSLFLSNMSLAKLAESDHRIKTCKLVGDLDYKKYRHSETPLTVQELAYCENDVKILLEYIELEKQDFETIQNIPYTSTGKVRRKVQNECSYELPYLYMDMEKYKVLKNTFTGGYVTANPIYLNEKLENVHSIDFASSYPYVMLSEKYPANKGKKIDIANANDVKTAKAILYGKKENYCGCFEIEFENLQIKNPFIPAYLSKSRCKTEKCVDFNGRISQASICRCFITDVDFSCITKCYTWSKCRLIDGYYFYKRMLPTEFRNIIIQLYKNKTAFKGVVGAETLYRLAKAYINSLYGMCVTDILTDVIKYLDGKWQEFPADKKQLAKFNYSRKNKKLYYAWGVFITAYARRNIYHAICDITAEGTVYTDTDSIKYLGDCDKKIDDYNKSVVEKLKRCGYTEDEYAPKDKKGKRHCIGIFEREDTADQFKTLGAKRYAGMYDGNLKITIAGISKIKARDYIKKHGGLDFIQPTMFIPAENSGKNIVTYNDEPVKFMLTDYLGNTKECNEKSCVHLYESEYQLGDLNRLFEYVSGLRQEEVTL